MRIALAAGWCLAANGAGARERTEDRAALDPGDLLGPQPGGHGRTRASGAKRALKVALEPATADRPVGAIRSRYINRRPTSPATRSVIWSIVSLTRTFCRPAN